MGISDELITRGWTQGDFADEDGRVCLYGAAECVVYGDVLNNIPTEDWGGVRWAELVRVQKALCDAAGQFAPAFNDAEGRTFNEVLRVAKHADEILNA